MDSETPQALNGEVTVSVLGCGWLGLPLAKFLIQHGIHVKGSTTTRDKLGLLRKEEIDPYFVTCAPDIEGDSLDGFFQSDILVLNIPFKRDLKDPVYYKRQIDSVARETARAPIKKLIFASSTSVYPPDFTDAREDAVFTAHDRRSEVLLKIEEILLRHNAFETTILRFAGLYGGSRKIGQFLSRKGNLKGADRRINLIHLDDCVAIVYQIIKQNIFGEVFNCVSDTHPTRRELYTKAAQNLGLPAPEFVEEENGPSKIVRNKKLKEKLGYRFQHPDPMKNI